jgi:hypothetical protein
MGNSLLTSVSTRLVSGHLTVLLDTLREARQIDCLLKPSVVGYILTPLMIVLRRNPGTAIPDQILEKLLLILAIVCESWWWTCQPAEWEQMFMLCGSILGGVGDQGKEKARDEETKTAAARTLQSLLYPRVPGISPQLQELRVERLRVLRLHVQNDTFIPILGQTFDWVLSYATSPDVSLRSAALDIIDILGEHYLPEYLVPSVLPGTVSTLSKVALGTPSGKGWASGESVRVALHIIEVFVVRAVGDDICFKEGAIRRVSDIEDLGSLETNSSGQPGQAHGSTRPRMTVRSTSWLNATSSQLHIALNTLTTIVSHPNPVALHALSQLSASILINTAHTLPSSQPLLLSFLLSMSMSSYERVARHAQLSLRRLLSPSSPAHRPLLQALAQITQGHLSSLPRFLMSGSDAKVRHSAELVTAGCRLTNEFSPSEGEDAAPPVFAVGQAIAKLLGPTGGIEKWGWSLLSALEFSPPAVTETNVSAAQITLEHDPNGQSTVHFPTLVLRWISTGDTQETIANMLRGLGSAAGHHGLFAVEWFVGVDRDRRSARAVSALWCAGRLLEGACSISLNGESSGKTINDHFVRAARATVRNIAGFWDSSEDVDMIPRSSDTEELLNTGDNRVIHEHITGLVTVRAPHELDGRIPGVPTRAPLKADHSLAHRAATLQLLAVAAGILQSRFTPMLMYTIYPLLHSIVSSSSFLSQTGLATLQYIASNASYASPANLLLSNFDYALDAVSRHLTRRLLDIDASRALVLLVKLVGRDVVHKASDVVETCFDRLDEFHGYEIVVDGLIDVLNEVVKAVDVEDGGSPKEDEPEFAAFVPSEDAARFRSLFDWLRRRSDLPDVDDTDFGSAPHEAWGKADKEAQNAPEGAASTLDTNGEPSGTATQLLTKQIVSRSTFFLTHHSPSIRAKILAVLSTSVPVLPASAVMPSIHRAWPFILNRLADPEPFVVSAAAVLVETLVVHHGDFMFRRIWDDVWPRFRTMLHNLESSDHQKSVITRRRLNPGRISAESAYTTFHRLHRAILRIMCLTARHVQAQDSSTWEVLVMMRRFLGVRAHDELQQHARDLYIAFGKMNEDAVWLALSASEGVVTGEMSFLEAPEWDIHANVQIIMTQLESV